MKKIFILTSLILATISTTASPAKSWAIDADTLASLKQNVCHDVVSFAKEEGLKKYKLKDCLKNLEVSYVDEVYNVDAIAPARYQIYFEDDYAKELAPTDQWIMCEVYLTEPLDPEKYEFSYCSIEG